MEDVEESDSDTTNSKNCTMNSSSIRKRALSLTSSEEAEDRRRQRSFEAGIKLTVRAKTEEEVWMGEKKEERVEAVKRQQKQEIFRLKEKTMEWVPTETEVQTEVQVGEGIKNS